MKLGRAILVALVVACGIIPMFGGLALAQYNSGSSHNTGISQGALCVNGSNLDGGVINLYCFAPDVHGNLAVTCNKAAGANCQFDLSQLVANAPTLTGFVCDGSPCPVNDAGY